jgi:hypothetical protein
MENNKELLEATIKGLQEKVNQLNNDLDTKKQELEDVNKPEMASEMFDKLESCITDGVDEANGNMCEEDFDKDWDIDYDGRVSVSGLHMNNTHSFVDMIMTEIKNNYRIVE